MKFFMRRIYIFIHSFIYNIHKKKKKKKKEEEEGGGFV